MNINFRELFIANFSRTSTFPNEKKNVYNPGMVEKIPGYEDGKYHPA